MSWEILQGDCIELLGLVSHSDREAKKHADQGQISIDELLAEEAA